MTVSISEIGSGNIYLPINTDQKPNGVFIRGLSSYDTSLAVYNASYTLQFGSNQQSFIAFVPFPQALLFQSTGLAYLDFDTEEVIDETYFSMIPPFLIQYYESQLKYSQVGSFPYVGVISLIYYIDDVLLMLQIPNGIVIYSIEQSKFYEIKLPANLINQEKISIYSTFLGNNVYTIIAYGSNPINVVLLQAQFSYSNTVLSPIQSFTISANTDEYAVGIVGNLNYVVGVVKLQTTTDIIFVSSEIYYYVYDIKTGTISSYNSGVLGFYFIYSGTTSISSIPRIFGIKQLSIYGYYVFTILYNVDNGQLTVFSFDIKTGNIESVGIPNTVLSTGSPIESFLQGNKVIITLLNPSTPIQQGNLYFVPIPYVLYEVTTTDMITVQYTQVTLEKSTLTISGYVYLSESGQPVSGGSIGLFNAESVMGNQIGIDSTPLATTKTNSDGSFTITYTYPNSPQDANVAIVASIDPVLIEYVTIYKQEYPYTGS